MKKKVNKAILFKVISSKFFVQKSKHVFIQLKQVLTFKVKLFIKLHLICIRRLMNDIYFLLR